MIDLSKRPLVTLAIITYNQEEYIKEALESALSQNYMPMEVVVSDDASSDNTFNIVNQICKAYKGPHSLRISRNNNNLGLAGNINKVIELSRGEIVCWAAGDDVSLPGKIEKLVSPMLADPRVVGVHSQVNQIDKNGVFIKVMRPNCAQIIDSSDVVIEMEIGVASQSHAFRKYVFERFGPLDESVTNESCVMAFRESCLGKIVLVCDSLTNYRVGVGVSTQRGKSIDELMVLEPVKYSRWWSSAYAQIYRDALLLGLDRQATLKIKRKCDLFNQILEVNIHKYNLASLFSALFKPGFTRVLIAFFRRNAPKKLMYFVYRNRGWLT